MFSFLLCIRFRYIDTSSEGDKKGVLWYEIEDTTNMYRYIGAPSMIRDQTMIFHCFDIVIRVGLEQI